MNRNPCLFFRTGCEDVKEQLKHKQVECKDVNDKIVHNNQKYQAVYTELQTANETISRLREEITTTNYMQQQIHDPNGQRNASQTMRKMISTHNRYDPLSQYNDSEEEDDMSHMTKEKKADGGKSNEANTKANSAVIIIDSHGNMLDGNKMYKNKEVKVVELGPGKKNIQGAIEYLIETEDIQPNTEIILAVGNNDLSTKDTDVVLGEMKGLTDLCKRKYPRNAIGVMPILPRMRNKVYNRKMKLLNAKMTDMESEELRIIENFEISEMESHSYLFKKDGVHFNPKGTAALVRIIKLYLNERFGMRPYDQYNYDQSG